MFIIKTSMGDIELVLDEENTKETAKNFRRYVQEGFYKETLFHRVISGFMIQGGGFSKDFLQKKTHEPIKNEAKLGQSNRKYTIAMARTMAPHSATSQFFINGADNLFLNYTNEQQPGYCVFGAVTKGQEVVDAIIAVKTGPRNGHSDVPLVDVVIEDIFEKKDAE